MTPKQIVHESAKRLKEIALGCAELDKGAGEAFAPGVGICGNINEALPWRRLRGYELSHQCRNIFYAAIARWPKHSGSVTFPVPGGMDAYEDHQRAGDQWNARSEYGQLRFELLDWIIEETKD